MQNLYASQPLSGVSPAFRFQAIRAMAVTLAPDARETPEPRLTSWKDRTTSLASPELEGCPGPYGWRNYGISHDGRLEVDVAGEATFIPAESSSCEHFASGRFVSLRKGKNGEMIFHKGGGACMLPDEWASKLT